MKSRTLFQCEMCNKEYQRENLAVECEASHKIPKKVEKPIYDSVDRKSYYPTSVNVIFTDGTSARYHRKE